MPRPPSVLQSRLLMLPLLRRMPLPQRHAATVPEYSVLEHACVDFAASLSESCERPSRWVPPERTLPTTPLTMLLAELGPFLSRRGQANSGELFFWFVRSSPHALMRSEPLPRSLLVCMVTLDGREGHLSVFAHSAFIAVTRAVQSHSHGDGEAAGTIDSSGRWQRPTS